MKFTSEHLKSLQQLYIALLAQALDMECRIAKALPAMSAQATAQELASALCVHHTETEAQMRRLESILVAHTGEARPAHCRVIESLLTEVRDRIRDADDCAVCDVALIAAAQLIEHHEIAIYGTLASWAQVLSYPADVEKLEAILKEEKAADRRLTAIAEFTNVLAA